MDRSAHATGHPVHEAGTPPPGEGHVHGAMVADFRRRFWISLALTVPVLLLTPEIQALLRFSLPQRPGIAVLIFLLSSAIYFYGGWPFLKGAAAELQKRLPGMMILIAVAISVAYLYSAAVVFGFRGHALFWELATLVDIMLLGHWLEMRSVMGASGALEKLVTLLPANAHRLEIDGSYEDVPVARLLAGERVMVRPGEKVPADGTVIDGATTVNEAMLTGESRPVDKNPGDDVVGGAINGEATFTMEVKKTGESTYLAQVITLVRKAQESRSRTQDLANRAALWLTLAAIGIGSATLVVWLLARKPFDFAVARMVTVMVIACPHALGLAVPLVVAVSTALSAQRGLLIRDRAAFERARNVDAVVFDKTGTLTQGRFGVTDVIPLGSRNPREILSRAAALEQGSEHPIARGIVESARSQGIELAAVTDFRAIPGRGAEGRVGGKTLRLVSPGYLKEKSILASNVYVRKAAAEGKTVVFLLAEDALEGAIALADLIRPESREAIGELKRLGIQVMMLTGDSLAVATWVARKLELDDFFGEVLPDQKAAKIQEIQQRGLKVAMVGDGINDAPALVAADVGIAIGAGTDVAIESADIVLVRSDPRDVIAIVTLARRTYRKMVQNLWWATGYNLITIPLAAGVLYGLGILLSPALGAVFMSASTIIVAVNARLLGRS